MEEEFKYVRSALDTVLGIITIVLGIMFLTLFLFVVARSHGYIVYFMPVFGAILFGEGIFYLTLYKRNYVVFNSKGILIDKGLIISTKKADYEEIDLVRTIGNDIRIGLKTGKEYRIRMNVLSVKDIEKINSILEEKLRVN